MGKGARAKRQERRAVLLNRGLVTKDDLSFVIGMTMENAENYAKNKNLRIRLYYANKEEKTKDVGPNAITVKVIDGIVVGAETNRRFND